MLDAGLENERCLWSPFILIHIAIPSATSSIYPVQIHLPRMYHMKYVQLRQHSLITII